jgi:hypothetical protein
MTRLNLFATMAFAIGVLGLPAGASAQDLPIGKAVQVTGLDGSRRGGTLVSLDGKTVVIQQRQGHATIPLAEVRTVTRPSYAILAGTLIGAGAGFVGGLAFCANQSDCPPQLVGLMYAGIGAGVGAAVGAMVKTARTNSRLVYRTPARTSIAMSPVVGRRAVGMHGVISW